MKYHPLKKTIILPLVTSLVLVANNFSLRADEEVNPPSESIDMASLANYNERDSAPSTDHENWTWEEEAGAGVVAVAGALGTYYAFRSGDEQPILTDSDFNNRNIDNGHVVTTDKDTITAGRANSLSVQAEQEAMPNKAISRELFKVTTLIPIPKIDPAKLRQGSNYQQVTLKSNEADVVEGQVIGVTCPTMNERDLLLYRLKMPEQPAAYQVNSTTYDCVPLDLIVQRRTEARRDFLLFRKIPDNTLVICNHVYMDKLHFYDQEGTELRDAGLKDIEPLPFIPFKEDGISWNGLFDIKDKSNACWRFFFGSQSPKVLYNPDGTTPPSSE